MLASGSHFNLKLEWLSLTTFWHHRYAAQIFRTEVVKPQKGNNKVPELQTQPTNRAAESDSGGKRMSGSCIKCALNVNEQLEPKCSELSGAPPALWPYGLTTQG